MERQTEITRRREEAERQRVIDGVWEQMEREQQEEMQARARANAEGVREVHGPPAGAQGVCGE